MALWREREERRRVREAERDQLVEAGLKASRKIIAAADALKANPTEAGVRRLLRAIGAYRALPVERLRELTILEPMAAWFQDGAYFPAQAVGEAAVLLYCAAFSTVGMSAYASARRAFKAAFERGNSANP